MRTLELLFAAPVPVGHRVEIRIFEDIQDGLFSQKKVSYQHLRDLDSGVVYAPHDVFWEGVGIRFGDRLGLLSEPRENLTEIERFVGKVSSCRMVTIQLGSEFQLQTTMEIEV